MAAHGNADAFAYGDGRAATSDGEPDEPEVRPARDARGARAESDDAAVEVNVDIELEELASEVSVLPPLPPIPAPPRAATVFARPSRGDHDDSRSERPEETRVQQLFGGGRTDGQAAREDRAWAWPWAKSRKSDSD